MLRVRQLLTEVLLDVTNSEIADVAHAVFTSAKAKQARGGKHIVVIVIVPLLFIIIINYYY